MELIRKVSDRGLVWEEVRRETLESNQWIDFRRLSYRLPDGTVADNFYSYSRYRDYVVIVATDEEGNYLLVRQFRPGIAAVTTEFPAGGMERTDSGAFAEDPGNGAPASPPAFPQKESSALAAAKRELLEETGYVSGEWSHLLTVPSDATICANYAHIYRAANCTKAAEQHLDDTEFLHVLKLTRDELRESINAGRFQQSVHIMAFLLSTQR